MSKNEPDHLHVCMIWSNFDTYVRFNEFCYLNCAPRVKYETPETNEGDRLFTLPNGSLQIISAEKNDSGKYVCVAFNAEGKSAVNAILDVKGILTTWLVLTFLSGISTKSVHTQLFIKGPVT